ncbi:hypothetical protein ANANG_G00046110 [Anguilla anguilla]|uniref:Vesicle transport v-SNARE N-terminal domain-containing protein n=1 Tax=Anguilla anguilla TaxID=7936 RepID=A0A9D3MU88_ANGAN|nr:hypothetical protein ANANG_G00046110 [Anguilla anguilla]
MSSDFESYEQDFGTLTAEITNKIGRIPKLGGEEKTQLVLNVDKQLEEVRELLEQMDLEVREIPVQSRGMYSNRLKSYKQEVEKLEKDFKRSRIAYSDEVRNDLLGTEGAPRRVRERICWTTRRGWKGHLGDWRPATRSPWKQVRTREWEARGGGLGGGERIASLEPRGGEPRRRV